MSEFDLCGKNSFCLNTPGGYECSCLPGFSGSGKVGCNRICKFQVLLSFKKTDFLTLLLFLQINHALRTMNAPVINNVWIKFVNVFHLSFWMAANVNIHVTGNNAVKMLNVILKIRKLFANVNLAVAVMLCLAVLTLMNAHHFCPWIQTVLVVLDRCVSTLWALSDVNARLALQVILIKKMAALVAYQDVLPIRNARIMLVVMFVLASVQMFVLLLNVVQTRSVFRLIILLNVNVLPVMLATVTILFTAVHRPVILFIVVSMHCASLIAQMNLFVNVNLALLEIPGLVEAVSHTQNVLLIPVRLEVNVKVEAVLKSVTIGNVVLAPNVIVTVDNANVFKIILVILKFCVFHRLLSVHDVSHCAV